MSLWEEQSDSRHFNIDSMCIKVKWHLEKIVLTNEKLSNY